MRARVSAYSTSRFQKYRRITSTDKTIVPCFKRRESEHHVDACLLPIDRILRIIAAILDRARSGVLIAWFKACYPGLRIGKGVVLGAGARIRVLNGAMLEIGARTTIEPRCLLVSEGMLTIGARSFIGTGATIVACGSIAIGSDALIAANVTIRDQDHRTDLEDTPYRLQGFDIRPVTIGSNVWLGVNAVVLKGVTIGDDAIVAAAAVVSRDVAASAVVAGVPARPVMRTPFNAYLST